MNPHERTATLLKLVGMGMVVFSIFALLAKPAPVMIHPGSLSEQALSALQQQGTYLTVNLYIGYGLSILGGLVMMGAGFTLTGKPKHPPIDGRG